MQLYRDAKETASSMFSAKRPPSKVRCAAIADGPKIAANEEHELPLSSLNRSVDKLASPGTEDAPAHPDQQTGQPIRGICSSFVVPRKVYTLHCRPDQNRFFRLPPQLLFLDCVGGVGRGDVRRMVRYKEYKSILRIPLRIRIRRRTMRRGL